ncbi:MAG: hypothetical protein ACMZI0_08360 [Symbiopectobacterium sp.]|uniref:hypothetical protein n=1 Tax=Symbiopectobacterium sp. TaxID=2952789 RepID=UPI0039E9AEC7
MFSLGGINTLGVLLGGALLSLAWWHGYTQGENRATERGEATISQLREAFADQEKQRAEQAAQTLQALQQRFERQVAVAHTSERNYLAHVALINAENRQLKRQIDDVTQRWLDEKGKPHAVSCVFTRGFVQYYNAALGVPDANDPGATAAPGGAGNTTRPTASAGEPLRPSPVTQRDILANITDNGQQCQVWRAQINGLLDYIEGLTP